MAARVIHFGIDHCHRIGVLRRAGYDIDHCLNVIEFQAALEADADAIVVNDEDGFLPEDLISVARTWSAAPIILFPNPIRTYSPHQVDLVVPTLTPPNEWLVDLANLIVHSRAVQAASQLIREKSQQLRRESATVREQSRRELARSCHEISRNANLIGRDTDRSSDPG